MMYTIAVLLCSFTNDYSVDLTCVTATAETDSCYATLAQIRQEKPDMVVKEFECRRVK